jgi:pimeloyl-ACP methyl ester carboxylesterase
MQFFNSSGVRLAFVDVRPTGEDRREPILLIHGFASNHAVNWANTLWIKTLTDAGRRVVAFDNRGHGQSDKLYEPADYMTDRMAEDARALMDYVGLERADVMGYSMGARITAFLTLKHPSRVRSAIFGGLGHHLIHGAGLPLGIADAMEAPALQSLVDPQERMFRAFAEATKSDLRALAACIRGSRQTLTDEQVASIKCPVLVAIGTKDTVAGDPRKLANLMPHGEALDIPNRDHNLAVGDKVYKQGVLEFLSRQSAATGA